MTNRGKYNATQVKHTFCAPSKYEILLGKKGNNLLFDLCFSKNDFYHLAGLHYLTDIRELKNDRAKIFDKLIDNSDFKN